MLDADSITPSHEEQERRWPKRAPVVNPAAMDMETHCMPKMVRRVAGAQSRPRAGDQVGDDAASECRTGDELGEGWLHRRRVSAWTAQGVVEAALPAPKKLCTLNLQG